MSHILIVVMLISTHMNHHTQVTMQEFASLQACRRAAEEIARQNKADPFGNAWGNLRMSCIPKGPTQ